MTETNLPKFELPTVRPMSLCEIFEAPNAPELLKEYAEECLLPELGEISPRAHLGEWDIFGTAVPSDGVASFGVYDRETLVGFAVMFIYLDRGKGKAIAATRSIFLASTHLNEANGLRLLECLEDYADLCGCTAFSYSASVGSRFAQLFSVQSRYRRGSSVFLRTLRGKGSVARGHSLAKLMGFDFDLMGIFGPRLAGNVAAVEMKAVDRADQEGLQDNSDIAIVTEVEAGHDPAISNALLELGRGEKYRIN
jgi:hypothetical protein